MRIAFRGNRKSAEKLVLSVFRGAAREKMSGERILFAGDSHRPLFAFLRNANSISRESKVRRPNWAMQEAEWTLLIMFVWDTVANAKHYATVAAREKMSGERILFAGDSHRPLFAFLKNPVSIWRY